MCCPRKHPLITHVSVTYAQSDFKDGLCRDYDVETKLAEVEEKVTEAVKAELAALAQEESRVRCVVWLFCGPGHLWSKKCVDHA